MDTDAAKQELIMAEKKRYLGDGVYADFDGYSIILTSENGVQILDRIYLEPDVYNALTQYVEHLMPTVDESGTMPKHVGQSAPNARGSRQRTCPP